MCCNGGVFTAQDELKALEVYKRADKDGDGLIQWNGMYPVIYASKDLSY